MKFHIFYEFFNGTFGQKFLNIIRFSIKYKKIIKICAIVFSILFSSLTTIYLINENHKLKNSPLNTLKPSYNKYVEFRKQSGLDLHIEVIKFGDTEKSIFDMLNSRGANINCNSMIEFSKKIKGYFELQFTQYSIKPKTTDIILFKPYWKNGIQVQKSGIIESYSGGIIKYISGDESGLEFSKIRFGDPLIANIYEFTFPIWCGKELHNATILTQGLSSSHNGYDMVTGNPDREVYSLTPGRVVDVYNGYTPSITILYFDEKEKPHKVIYMHLVNIRVKIGDYVNFDTLIGNYANIGYSFGPHVHIEWIGPNGEIDDPLPLIDARAPYIMFRDINHYYVCGNNLYNGRAI